MKHPVATRLRALRRQGFRRRNNRPGAPPGSLEPVASAQDAAAQPSARLLLMHYASEGEVVELPGPAIEAAAAAGAAADAQRITWLHLYV